MPIFCQRLVMTEIGRCMQAQQKSRKLIKKTVIAIAATGACTAISANIWQTGRSQHKQRDSSSPSQQVSHRALQ